MIYLLYGAAALIAFALCMTAMRDYGRFLFLGAFILNYHAIGLDIGVYLTLDKVFAWIGVFIILSMGIVLPRRGWFYVYSAMIGYMTLITAFMFVTGALNSQIAYVHSMGWGTGQSMLLLPVQYVSQVTVWSVLIVGYALGRQEQVVSGFIWGAISNAIIGFYQVLAAIKGLPWLPRDVLTKLSGDNGGQFQIRKTDLFRLSGLAGEPKHAAACFVVAIVLLMSLPIAGRKWKMSVLGLALIATLSTSGCIAFVVIYGVFMLYRHKMVQFLLAAFVALALFLATQVSSTFAFLVDTRIVTRLADPSNNEKKDAALIDVAEHDPTILITGVGAGGIELFLMKWMDVEVLERGSAIGPTYLLTETLGDYGIIGTALLFILIIGIGGYFRGELRVLYMALVVALLMLPRFTVLPAVLLVVGSMMRGIDDDAEDAYFDEIVEQSSEVSVAE
jgi:hypothetical protein